MNGDCYKLNPLQRGGTSQGQRMLPALSPSHVQLDERRIEDLICFADRYAELLAYFDRDNQYTRETGDWRPFLARDFSTAIARVVKTNHRLVGNTFDKYLRQAEADLSPASFTPLIDIVFSLHLEIERLNNPSIAGTPLMEDLRSEIDGRLKGSLKKLISLRKAGVAANLIDPGLLTNSSAEAYPFMDASGVLSQPFSLLWIVKDNPADIVAGWEDYHLNYVVPDAGAFGDPAWPVSGRLNFAISFVRAIFDNGYHAYIRILTRAERHLEHSLSQYPRHKPHNALLLAFFHIFSFAQEALNRFTEEHLRFYFRKVLHLKEKPAVPDSAHVLVELAAHNRSEHQIKGGTEMKGGKDPRRVPLIYVTDDELTANRAVVKSLRSVFVDPDPASGGVFDAPIANSSDGMGAALEMEDPLWRGFGEKQAGLSARTMRRARVGFAVAAPILRLKEGLRRITFKFHFAEDSTFIGTPPNAFVNSLGVRLSGAGGWIECGELAGSSSGNFVRFEYSSTRRGRTLEVGVELSADMDAVTDFDPEKLEGGYGTRWPVAEITLAPDSPENFHPRLARLRIDQIEISTEVADIKDLVVQTDSGVQDPSKPFQPFGTRPRQGSRFYVGSREAFSKNLGFMQLKLEWAGLPQTGFQGHYQYIGSNGTSTLHYLDIGNNDAFKAQVRLLKNGSWSPAVTRNLFASGTGRPALDRTWSFWRSQLPFEAQPGLDPVESFDVDSKGGFLVFELRTPESAFGHEAYPQAYSRQILALSRPGASENGTLPKEPYTPTIQSISCRYTASISMEFEHGHDAQKGQFFHLHPFGYAEVRGESNHVPLMPGFSHRTGSGGEQPFQGALYVGLADAPPDRIVSLLFQVAEGTEDASLDPPALTWSYLSANRWVELGSHRLADSTNGLLGSGIVRVRIPRDATSDDTLVAPGCRWLRLSTPGPCQALPLLRDVRAQAVRVTFEDRGNDLSHLKAPLPAGSISKLLHGDSAVKQISQPYASFGGRPQEEPNRFYNRVSERLRHKQRAITIWDYERLVLEEFPFLYKVKCLNHTNESTELAPGAIRVVVVPDVRKLKGGNRFQPSISNQNRLRIQQFLNSLNCPFADLAVVNPRYEAIQVHCNASFKSGLDPLFHQRQLALDIDRFLAPWAFEQEREIQFGGSLHQSLIIKFVEDLPYLDFVTDFVLDVYLGTTPIRLQVEEAVTATSRSILTSHQTHNIGLEVCATT